MRINPPSSRDGCDSRRELLWGAVAVSGLAAAIGAFVVTSAPEGARAPTTTVHVLMVAAPGMVGLAVLARSRDNRFALLLLGSTILLCLAALAESGDATAYSVGRIA